MFDLADKVVLITGAGSGIGRSHAEYFARNGARVIVHDISEERCRETMAAVGAAGGKSSSIAADVSDVETLTKRIDEAERRHGRIDVLVNNAGIVGDSPMDEVTLDDLNRMIRIHVRGSFFATKAVIPGMKRRNAGRIINTSSTWGMTGYPRASTYSAAKAALIGLTKAWAKEFAPWKINVNAIAPGGINTALLVTSPERLRSMPLGRHGEPIEVSYVAGFLASSASSFMTGQVINLSGGEIIVGC